MKNAIRFLIAAFFAWSAPAFAADNTLIVTPGIGVTTRSKDIGAGLQLPYVGIADGSGNELGLTGNPFFIGFGTGVTLPAFASPPAVSLNTTPSLANGNGVVPTQGGNVLSATNGIFANVLQGNAVLSATNGLFSNLLQGNAVLSTSNPIFVTGTGTAGSAATNPITVQGIASMTPLLSNPGTAANWGLGATGSSVPANAIYVGANVGGNLVGLTPGTAGSAGSQVWSVQGIASMTPLLVNPGTAANWGVGATGSAVPANAQYIGIVSGGNLTGWTGAVTVGSGGIASGAIASGAVASGAIASGAVASGAYASGAISDGANVTLGSKADAKSAATDTTPITQMQVLKEISAMEQAPASRAVTQGTSPWVTNQSSQYPATSVPYTASATGTTGATTATLAGVPSVTTYLCGFSIRANATAAATGNATVTGTITGTLNFTQWTAPNASGLGVTEEIFTPCVPASGTNQSVAVVSAAPGTGGVVSVTAWGYKL